METKKLIIFGLINLVGAGLSGASGGGAGLISSPLLVTLGVPPQTAIATAKFGGLGTTVGTSLRFFQERMTNARQIVIFSLFGAIGAVGGSLLLVSLQSHQELLTKLMAWSILLIGIPMLYFRNLGLETISRTRTVKTIGAVLLTLGVILQSALSSGIGSLQMLVLMGCFGMTALTASATRRAMQLTVAAVSLGIFIFNGLVDYKLGAVWFTTAVIGGFIGAHIAVKRGNKFVLTLLGISSAALAIQLLLSSQ